MQIIIILISTIISILGVSLNTKKRNKSLNKYGWFFICLISLLGIINFVQYSSLEEDKKSKETKELIREQNRQTELLEQLLINSQPLENYSLYFYFDIDSSYYEFSNAIKMYEKVLKNELNLSKIYGGYNINITKSKLFPSEKFPLLHTLGNHIIIQTSFTYKDSLHLDIQSGFGNPIKGFNVDIVVDEKKNMTLRFSDNVPSKLKSDLNFTSYYQLINSKVKISPVIDERYRKLMNKYFGKLKEMEIINKNGTRIRVNNLAKMYYLNDSLLYYEGILKIK